MSPAQNRSGSDPGVVETQLGHLDKRVDTIVNYDDFSIARNCLTPISEMVRDVVGRFYSGVTRYTTNAFLRMKLGRALSERELTRRCTAVETRRGQAWHQQPALTAAQTRCGGAAPVVDKPGPRGARKVAHVRHHRLRGHHRLHPRRFHHGRRPSRRADAAGEKILIIVGSAVGAFFVGNSMTVVKEGRAGRSVPASRAAKVHAGAVHGDADAALSDLCEDARKACSRCGPTSTETHNGNCSSRRRPCCCTIITPSSSSRLPALLSSGGIRLNQLDSLMDLDIETHYHQGGRPIKAIQAFADGLPAFGIVAAVLGVIARWSRSASRQPNSTS